MSLATVDESNWIAAIRWLTIATLLLVLTACGGKSYVVLMPDADGSVGKVTVTTAQGTTVLENERQATQFSAAAGSSFVVDDAQIRKDFGAALAATPKKPRIFRIYFETAGENLTANSRADIPKILEEIGMRPAPDISISGHADTVGSDEENIALGLRRARFVADVIQRAGIGAVSITIESHGEKNPVVGTADNVPEPRNRRVEVSVR